MSPTPRSLVKAILASPDDPRPRLVELRLIVAQRLDSIDSARDTASLARCVLDIEAALRALDVRGAPDSPVDDLIARRTARGAK